MEMQQRAKDFSLGIGVHELEIEDFLQGPIAPCCRYMAKSVLSSSRSSTTAAAAAAASPGADAGASEGDPHTPEMRGKAGGGKEWSTPVGGEQGDVSPMPTPGTGKVEGKAGGSGKAGGKDRGGEEEEEGEEGEEDGEDEEDDDGFADAEQDFLLSPSGSSRVSSPTARSAQQSHALASDSFYDAIELAVDEGSGGGGGGGGGGGAVPKFGRAGQLLPSFEVYGRDKWEAIEWLEEHIGGTDFVKLQILMVQTDSPDYCGTDMQVKRFIGR